MSDIQPAIAPIPPTMEVGYNYPWPFNRYGTGIGPRDLENEPPLGNNSDVPLFRNLTTHPPEGSLARNLTFLRDELKIKKVRMFLLCNAWNYGSRPRVSKGIFLVPDLHPLFIKHFREMLEVFAAKEMQILPSLIDFGAFYELDAIGRGAGSGRTEIARGGRKKFFDTVLKPFLAVSAEPALRKTIFAWEVINEPRWPLTNVSVINLLPGVPPRPHTSTLGNDLDQEEMSIFIREALDIIEAAGFPSTVGHRFLGDLTRESLAGSAMPGGTMPQFHYYAKKAPSPAKLQIPGDPDEIPAFADLARDVRTKNAFIGEFHSFATPDDLDGRWPECGGRDATLRSASFERLKVLARKRYPLVFIWPDGGPKGADETDALKLRPDTILSIKDFTRGLFPNGVP